MVERLAMRKKIAMVGAELEENLGMRYIASSLEAAGHEVHIVEFNARPDMERSVHTVIGMAPDIVGLSMIFTSRAPEFCEFASRLRSKGFRGHIIAGGPFAAFNAETLLDTYRAFDSVGLGEGEQLMPDLAANLDKPALVDGLCFRTEDGSIAMTAKRPNPRNLDDLPFPRRTSFHGYFGKPIASILSSRGCWRDCAFCSINAWYQKSGGGHRFRVRSIDNIVEEMRSLYFDHGIRIFNFQDDNFFLPDHGKAAARFAQLRDRLKAEGVTDIAIAVKARPDSITEESIAILDELRLFRVFLGVENASENGLNNLNRKNTVEQVLHAIEILNKYDVHLAFNILMFEPDASMGDLLVNLRFIERHIENPFNFCRAEAYPGTGLETKLLKEGALLGDWFGYDYRIRDPKVELFHSIANYGFFDRNFSNNGLHYFNMQVDFCFQLLRRFHPGVLSEKLRASIKNFIKATNLDTYECLGEIYDFVAGVELSDTGRIRDFSAHMRDTVDSRSDALYEKGEALLQKLDAVYDSLSARSTTSAVVMPEFARSGSPEIRKASSDAELFSLIPGSRFGLSPSVVPYAVFQQYRMTNFS